jgi:hypothetical protein
MKRFVERAVRLGAVLALCGAAGAPVWAQTQVYRCGNEYTNQPNGRADCKPMTGGNITIVRGTAPTNYGASDAQRPARAGGTPGSAQDTIPGVVQRQRDADRKAILQRELERAQKRQAELEAEYKNGEPDKIGGEAHNYQKYLDRVADLKASIARNQSDIEGIQRELARVSGN